ncbi:hypothetical protein [Terriglobus roseus]|uniref:Uncharacterized protein n=1 Tax=Terriglobus roseus TaxID=392734 RepID=A0A1H4KT46_9BACT|nr:hypothetical protein [Terriglobus roseus]SEB61082.1 hypothetical protein SAMN05443244_1321 [Terriglobus roseus]
MSTAPTGVTAELETRNEERAANTAAAIEVVVCLGPWYEDAPGESLSPLLQTLSQALGERASSAMIAYPASDSHARSWQQEGLLLQPYQPSTKMRELAMQTATSYLSLYEIMRAHESFCGLLLGAEAQSLQPAAIHGMVEAICDRGADVAIARYDLTPNEGLVNASILYPLTRAVFQVKATFPLALDLAMSTRMAERMATAAQRCTTTGQLEGLVWPAAEAATAAFTLAEVSAGVRQLPHPTGGDLSFILNTIASSLFLDIEAKASFWQRTRPTLPLLAIDAVPTQTPAADPVGPEEIKELIEGFRIAYGNLHEIWSLVLPPQTLLGLKRLSRLPVEEFTLPDALWVRIIYDFVLAHRLRTINRNHLMGSLTPLYLAWVASHIIAGANGSSLDSLARAFEADKPYLVSRWRWPDRFNP